MQKDFQRNCAHRVSFLSGTGLSRAVRFGLPPNGRTTAAVSRPVGAAFCSLAFLVFATLGVVGCAKDKLVSLLRATRPSEGRLVGAPCLRITPPGLQKAPSLPTGSTRGSGLAEDGSTTVRNSREGA